MTRWLGLVLLPAAAALAATLIAQEPDALRNRYKIEVNPINYPQKTPQDAMKSIAKALDAGRFDYFLAHLADPRFVDPRVAEYQSLLFPKSLTQKEEEDIARESDPAKRKAKVVEKEIRDKARAVVAFGRLVDETRKNLEEDPVLLKELRLIAKDGEWETDDEKSIGTLKALTPRRVTLRKREDRWFMEEKSR